MGRGKQAAVARPRDASANRGTTGVAATPRITGVATASMFAAVALCFFLSGVASLMFEVVWSRLLRLVFGSTTLAISTILVAYMLGLGLGGLVGGRVGSRFRNGVRAYGMLEVAIALYALAVPTLLGVFPWLNLHLLSGAGLWTMALGRFFAVLALLLIPTLCMGATLPILVNALVRDRENMAGRVGLLYGLNTLGAVAGVFLSSFVLLPGMGVTRTNMTAAAIDVAVGIVAALLLAPRWSRGEEVAAEAPTPAALHVRRWNPALLSYGLVGATALAYEVCWSRALSLILGSSVYAFATMLGAFLTGIALGSLVARRWFDRLSRPLPAYAAGLALLGMFSIATAFALNRLPDLFLNLMQRFGPSPSGVVATNVLVATAAMLAPTLVLGALFPLVVRALTGSGRDPGGAVGDVYFINTLGSATGAFSTGFLLIPAFGVAATMAGAAAVNLLAAAAITLWQREWVGRSRAIMAAACVAGAAIVMVHPPGWDQIRMTRGAYRSIAEHLDYGIEMLPLEGMHEEEVVYYRDGVNTTVSVHRDRGNIRLRVNGKVDASSGRDMPTQVLSGQVPLLFGPSAQRVLVIGLASGITVGSVTLHEPERVEVVELEPAIVDVARFFGEFNHHALDNPTVHVITDDGRTYLAYTPERYDTIISEPSNPWITGASSLFTREFFKAAHGALRPGGRLLQWVQLYEMEPVTMRSILAALTSEFPYVYGFMSKAEVPDLLMLASDAPIDPANLPEWERLPAAVRDDLQRVGVFSTLDLWSLLRFTPEDMRAVAADAPVENSDDNLYVEFRAPWSVYGPSMIETSSIFAERPTLGVVTVARQAGPVSPERLADVALSYLERGATATAGAILADMQAQQPGAPAEAVRVAVDEVNGKAGKDAIGSLYRMALAQPDRSYLWLRLTDLLVEDERYAEALSTVDAALAREPTNLTARQQRLHILVELGRAAEARAEATTLLRTSYAAITPEIWADSARAAAAAGDPATAAREMQIYLEQMPYSPEEWQALAAAERSLGDEEAATRADTNATRAERNLVLMVHRDARRWASLSPVRAMRALRTALIMDPSYEPARRDLERLQASQPKKP